MRWCRNVLRSAVGSSTGRNLHSRTSSWFVSGHSVVPIVNVRPEFDNLGGDVAASLTV